MIIKNIFIELFQFLLFFAFIIGIITNDLFTCIFYGISFILATIAKELYLQSIVRRNYNEIR